MAKFKTMWHPMWHPAVRKVYVWQGSLVVRHQAGNQVPDYQADDKLITIASHDAEKRNAEAVKQDAVKEEVAKQNAIQQNALLLKEIGETNNWARLGAQLYFGWFTLMIIINGVGMSWLFTYKDAIPRFARLMFVIFILLNLVGTISTILLSKRMLESDRRIKEVLTGLTRNHVLADLSSAPESPMPRQAFNIVFAFFSIALFILLLFWMVLAMWPQVFLA